MMWLPFGIGRGRTDPRWPRAAPVGEVPFAVLDTEFTSLDHRSNRMLSFGAVRMTGSRILLGEQLYRVVNPGVEVPAAGVLVHGLRPHEIEAAAPPQQAMEEIVDFLGGAVLVGHFLSIDLKVLRKELGGRTPLANPAVCTARLHQWILGRRPYVDGLEQLLERLDLASVAAYWGVQATDAHHALGDAFVTARLLQRQLSELSALGAHSLGELLDAAAA
jgi:DNA polymerase III epsilon subunit-like protein